MRFVRWCSSALIGHIVFFELCVGLPFYLIFLPIIYSQGGLTLEWAVYMAFICATVWGLGGVLFWYAVSRPMRQRRGLE
jgi:hypothetical protein